MNPGTQVVAPDGLGPLKKGISYYFLKNAPTCGWATLVEFTDQKKGRRVHIHRITSQQFVDAINADVPGPKLVVAKKQRKLPPWLSKIEESSLDELDLQRGMGCAKTYREYTQDRFGFIEGLIPRLNEILSVPNPFSIINEHAKNTKPKQNRERLAEWFFAYICHERKMLALCPEFGNIGSYNKSDPKYNGTHFGPVSHDKGKSYGWPSAMFTSQIEASVERRLETGWSKRAIYIDALQKDFGCRGQKNQRGDWVPYHPEGKAFPDTFGKFWYRWYQKIDLKKTNISLYGEHQARAKAASLGSYAEDVGTLLAELEVDAYFLKERPKIPVADGVSGRLCVARGVCVGSKNVVGMGFSYENEKAEAYSAMLFSAAIGLPATAELWGLPLGVLLDAPLKGLPPHLISDRGKAPIAAIVGNLMAKFPVKELTESYEGQSKPSVEASHPRDKNIKGPPSFLVSDKDPIQLIQRELCRGALDNHQSYVGDLIIGSRATGKTVATPYALGQLLDSQGLNDGIHVTEETAVRTFLPKIDYVIRDGAFWFETRSYSSDEIEATGVFQELNAGQEITVRGYHLPMNLMWAWIEFQGKLYRLKQKLPARMGQHEMMMSMAQIMLEAEVKRQLDTEQVRSANAAAVEAQARFEDYTGVSWGNTSKQAGRPRKSPDAAIEKKILSPRAARQGRRAA